MSTPKRATIYFDADIHRALRLRAAASDQSISDMVNEAVKLALAGDAEDLAAFGERKREPNLDLEQLVKALKRRGKL
jgi:plasmid stability protein